MSYNSDKAWHNRMGLYVENYIFVNAYFQPLFILTVLSSEKQLEKLKKMLNIIKLPEYDIWGDTWKNYEGV
jgi:hypothetical protein